MNILISFGFLSDIIELNLALGYTLISSVIFCRIILCEEKYYRHCSVGFGVLQLT